MEFSQSFRRVGIWTRARMRDIGRLFRLPRLPEITAKPVSLGKVRIRPRIVIGIVAAIILYYVIGGFLLHRIDDRLPFTGRSAEAAVPPPGGSSLVAMTAALVAREGVAPRWVANDPFFYPGAFLEIMPAYQTGIFEVIFRLTTTLADDLGTTLRGQAPDPAAPTEQPPAEPPAEAAAALGSGTVDPALTAARNALAVRPRQWFWSPVAGIRPTPPAEWRYATAVKGLRIFNGQLALGNAALDLSPEGLKLLIRRIDEDLTVRQSTIEAHLRDETGVFFHPSVDAKFYHVKGALYGAAVLLAALQRDAAAIIEEEPAVGEAFTRALAALEAGARMSPAFVFNGSLESSFVPCPMCTLGYRVTEARLALRTLEDRL